MGLFSYPRHTRIILLTCVSAFFFWPYWTFSFKDFLSVFKYSNLATNVSLSNVSLSNVSNVTWDINKTRASDTDPYRDIDPLPYLPNYPKGVISTNTPNSSCIPTNTPTNSTFSTSMPEMKPTPTPKALGLVTIIPYPKKNLDSFNFTLIRPRYHFDMSPDLPKNQIPHNVLAVIH